MTFNSKEICDIITSCKDSQISKLSCGDFTIEFYDRNIDSNPPVEFVPITDRFEDKHSEKPESEIDLDELAITDPARWEKLLLDQQTE